MKICSKCKKEKDESEFKEDKRFKSGLFTYCKDCYREYHNKYQREYSKTNKWKEYYKPYQKEYQKTDKFKECQRNYKKKKRLIDPKYKLDRNISTAISVSLNGKKAGRNWEILTGYKIEELIIHIEKRFEPWMSWDNYGKVVGCWSIDHIKPISSFNYINPEDKEFKKCWSLDNLRPLGVIENISKSNKH
jgi:hypothetical protein